MNQALMFNGLEFIYAGASEPIFSDISLRIYRGWTAIVGKSGAGKTTLAKLIAQKAKTSVYYVEQRMDNAPNNLAVFLAAANREAFLLKEGLKVADDWLDRWERLSYGERKRAQIAAALYENPELLIIDEPTNHLDAQAKEYIIEALKKYKGFGLLISHDRELLDTLSDRTIFMQNKSAQVRGGSYTIVAQEIEREKAYTIKLRDRQSEEIKRLKKQTQIQREKTERSEKRVSKRFLDPKDSDAREKIGRAIVSGKDASDAVIFSRYQSRLKYAEEKLERIDSIYETGVTIEASFYPKLFPIVIEAGRAVQKDSRIGIVGRNGSGKSLFIRHFVESRKWDEKLLYIPQEIDVNGSKKIIDGIRLMKSEDKGFIMSLIVRLGSDPKTLLQTSLPSPGETRKLLLAIGLLKKPALIVMDEPTNHLDIASIEALEKALKAYNGAALLVSHDRRFLSAITNEIWRF